MAAPTVASLTDGIRQLIFKAVDNTYEAAKDYAGAPSNFSIATADTTVFTLAAGEIGFVQNLHASVGLAVKKGAGATTINFSFVLAPGAATDTGGGGKEKIEDWVGAVSVAAIPSGTARYIAWKQAIT